VNGESLLRKITRQVRKEQTRNLIIKTAYDLFSEKGIMNTRVSDIALAAGISHGAIFVHFPSLEELIEEVVEIYGEKIALKTHQLALSCENTEQFLRAHLEAIRECERFYTNLVIENRMLPQGGRYSWMSIQSAVSFHFNGVIEKEVQTEPDIPGYMLFNMWAGLLHYYLANGDLFAPEGSVIEHCGDELIKSYMRMLNAINQKQ
jgi:AcrR family transcriptional regulator